MNFKRSIEVAGGLALVLALASATFPATAQELTAVERLYADLAKLPPAERTAKLYEGAKKEGQFTLTRGYAGAEGIAHLRLFEARYPGITVKFENMPSQKSVERVIAEATAGRYLTDISSSTGSDLRLMLERQIAARNPTPEVSRILPQFRGFIDPTGQNRYVPWYATTQGIAYNTNLMSKEDAPKSWLDLCNPKYKGMMSFEPGEPRWLTGVYHIFGDDMEKTRAFLECIGKNEPIVMVGHISRIMLMMAGDHAMSPNTLLYRGVFDNRQNSRKAPFAPVYEAPVFMDSVNLNIVKNAPHPHAAALHVDWCLGEESQAYIHGKFRETVSYKHPFLPDDAQIVVNNFVDKQIVDQLLDYWRQYVKK